MDFWDRFSPFWLISALFVGLHLADAKISLGLVIIVIAFTVVVQLSEWSDL